MELFQTSDIVAFSEVWVSDEGVDRLRVEGWIMFHELKKRRAKTGRHPAGIIVFIREKYKTFVRETKGTCKDIVFLILELNHSQIALGFAYNPHPSSPYANDEFLDELEEDILQIRSMGVEDILLMGDWNARTGELDDIVRGEADGDPAVPYSILPDNYVPSPDLAQRSNEDKIVNRAGLNLVEFMKSLSLVFLNGRKRGDHLGDFTFVAPQGSSSIDYGIVSHQFYYSIDQFTVLERVVDSGHFPIRAIIDLPTSNIGCENETVQAPERKTSLERFTWKHEESTKFVESVHNMFPVTFDKCREHCRNNKMQDAIKEMVDMLKHAAVQCTMQRVAHRATKTRPRRAPWWTARCRLAKKDWRLALSAMRKHRTTDSIDKMLQKKKEYKKERKQAQTKLKKERRDEILKLAEMANGKDMWAKIKKYVKQSSPNSRKISEVQWKDYFGQTFNSKNKKMRRSMRSRMIILLTNI